MLYNIQQYKNDHPNFSSLSQRWTQTLASSLFCRDFFSRFESSFWKNEVIPLFQKRAKREEEKADGRRFPTPTSSTDRHDLIFIENYYFTYLEKNTQISNIDFLVYNSKSSIVIVSMKV